MQGCGSGCSRVEQPLRELLIRAAGVVLMAFLLLGPATAAAAALPWTVLRPGPASSSSSAVSDWQEVAPPAAVQQLQERLALRQPRLRILSPADGALLPDGPWTLRLAVTDWPLQAAGPLGIGPHLVVQLDDAPPRRISDTSLTLPPLAPGSHRLSVYAAQPWGEALRNPGALAQIRVHRLAANPLSLPAAGTPQLIPVSAVAALAESPLLLDWVLIDTPLQQLRPDDSRWRLRVRIDGVGLLLDRDAPLWLSGLPAGSHALQLDLVDPSGEPLNPPFNSLVRELAVGTGPAPIWLQGPLSAEALAELSGEIPAAGRRAAPSPQPAVKPGAPAPAAAEPEPGPESPGQSRGRRSETSPEPQSPSGAAIGIASGAGNGSTGAERTSLSPSGPAASAEAADASTQGPQAELPGAAVAETAKTLPAEPSEQQASAAGDAADGATGEGGAPAARPRSLNSDAGDATLIPPDSDQAPFNPWVPLAGRTTPDSAAAPSTDALPLAGFHSGLSALERAPGSMAR